jgi:hypothetical protein
MDTIRVSKMINAPLSYAFKWCTDFREDDTQLIGSKSQRKILEKSKKRVIYATLYNNEKGEQKVAIDIVALKPPRSWDLEYFGEEDDETGTYRLTSLGKSKTRLDMVFKEKWKISNPPSKDWQVQHTSGVWDKYVAALERDYNSGKGSA